MFGIFSRRYYVAECTEVSSGEFYLLHFHLLHDSAPKAMTKTHVGFCIG